MSKPYDRSDAGHLENCALAFRLGQEQRKTTTIHNEQVKTEPVYGQSISPQAYAQPGTLSIGFVTAIPFFNIALCHMAF